MKLPVCVLAMLRLGHRTAVVALPCIETLLVADTVAVFVYTAQLDVEVLAVMCTDAAAPAPILPKEQPSVWLPVAPAMEQVPGPLYPGPMLQLTPAGRGSFNVTAVAVPVPAALPLLTCMVKPIAVPAPTDGASAALLTLSTGQASPVIFATKASLPPARVA